LAPETLARVVWVLFRRQFMPLALTGFAIIIVTLALRLATTRFGWSLKKLAPDPARLNPLTRLKDMPRHNLNSLVEAVILLPLFLGAVYVMARDKLDTLLTLPLTGVEHAAGFIASSLMELFWKAAGVFLVFGSVDLFRQLKRYRQELRMTKQEVREEVKESEGNPQMKRRIRRIQRDRARRQMMKEVPNATAVVVNPTHYAVAIKYHLDTMAAPMVVAKGKNYLAQRIRMKAIEHQVP